MARIIRNSLDPVPNVDHEIGGEKLTQQHMAAETDINNIVAQYMKTGTLGDPNAKRQPMFGDFSATDFQQMRNTIADAEQAFATLPARVRERFGNDPYQVIRFLDKPENLKEAIKLGLVPEPEPVIDPSIKNPVLTDLVADSEANPFKKPV